MTGTRLDLLPFLIKPLLWLLLALLVGFAGFILWWLWRAWRSPRPWHWRLLIAAPPLALIGWLGVIWIQGQLERRQHETRYNLVRQNFEAHCKKSGVKIYKTVSNVKGLIFIRWRPEDGNDGSQPGDQYRLDDPFGLTCWAEDCFMRMLRVTGGMELDPHRALEKNWDNPYIGYDYIETTDPRDERKYRYTKIFEDNPKRLLEPKLTRRPIDQYTARYGIVWEDLSTQQDREQWIAGSLLRIVDVTNQEVLADRVAYMFDRGLGRDARKRVPWVSAQRKACGRMPTPSDQVAGEVSLTEMRDFAVQVLIPESVQ